ncbi:hypothetical protein DM785_02520 [Deinococcus actinosclerus]|nr:hypothetical protein DM785_02520 [Deinococcus actinosclerus]
MNTEPRFSFPSLAAIKAANNAAGRTFFTGGHTGAQYHGGLLAGRYFVHSLPGEGATRRYWVAGAISAAGDVRNLGDSFPTLEAARKCARAVALGEALAAFVIEPAPVAPERTAHGVSVEGAQLFMYLDTSCKPAYQARVNLHATAAGHIMRGAFSVERYAVALRGVVALAAREYVREYRGTEYGNAFRPAARAVAAVELLEAECAEFNVNRWGLAAEYLARVPGAALAAAPAAAVAL